MGGVYVTTVDEKRAIDPFPGSFYNAISELCADARAA